MRSQTTLQEIRGRAVDHIAATPSSVDIQPTRVTPTSRRVVAVHQAADIWLCSKQWLQTVTVTSHARNQPRVVFFIPKYARSIIMELIIVQIIGTSALLLSQLVIAFCNSLNGWR